MRGAASLRRALKQFDGDLSDLKAIHKQAADLVLTRAERDAPVRTGKLKASLRTGATRTSAIVRSAGRSVPYAAPVHWGWPTRPRPAKGWRGGPIKANPFVYDAAMDLHEQLEDNYLAAIERLMLKIRGAET